MCLAYPAQVVDLEEGGVAVIRVRGRLARTALLALDGRPPRPGDWLLVQSGLALARIDADEAAHRDRLLDEMAAHP